MMQASVFQYDPAYTTCGLQEDEAGDVWSYIHTGHVMENGALSDVQAWRWLVDHAGDGVILYP